MKKILATIALVLVIAPLGGSSAPYKAPTPIVQSRTSLITPEVLAAIAAPVSSSVKSAASISIEDVKTIEDVRSWVYQTCPAVKIAVIPGKASFYLPQNSAIAVGSETEEKWMSFVIAHEMSHHYQWVENNGNLGRWNSGMGSKEGLPPELEVQADYMAFEVAGSVSAIANYAKETSTVLEIAEAQRVINFGKSFGC